MSQFNQPAVANPDDKIVWAESKGALLLFFPTELKTAVPTQHGESDAVAAKVVRLNDGRVWENGLVFPTALVTQIKTAVPDGMVLGTLGQGENTKGNAPWLLLAHTAEDVARAEAWLAANPRNQFQQAAPPTPAAQAPAWGQQPPAVAPAAPATGGWGSPPAAVQAAPAWGAQPAAPATTPAASPTAATAGSWGAAAPAPAPAVSVDPQLVAALAAKGVNLPPGATQQTAEGIWAMVSQG